MATPATPPDTAAAYEWHRRPVGCTGRCPVCNLPRAIGGIHRATRPGEGTTKRYLRRRKSRKGWKDEQVGPYWFDWRDRAEENRGRDRPAEGALSIKDCSPKMSLSGFYRGYVRPRLVNLERHPNTLTHYDCAIRRWEQYTDDRPLEDIEYDIDLQHFIQGLAQRTGILDEKLSQNTIKNHIKVIQRLLSVAAGGERGSVVRPANLIKHVWFPNTPGEPREVTAWELREIGHWIDTLADADEPKHLPVPAADWWRSLILFVYNTGQRIGSVLQARWTWFDHTGRWMTIPAKHYKRSRDHTFYCNDHALEAVEEIRSGCDELFPWPHSLSHFRNVARRMFLRAGFGDNRRRAVLSGKYLHGLRGAMITELHSRGHGTVAQVMAGHRTVTLTHYVDKRSIVTAMEDLPQPSMTMPYPAPTELAAKSGGRGRR